MKIAYITHDSIAEGIGKSQILALCKKLVENRIEVHLFTFEKMHPSEILQSEVQNAGINWTWFPFNQGNRFASIKRIYTLKKIKGEYDLIHARGDLPAFSAVLRKKEPVIWDIRSLWADQRAILNSRKFNAVTRKVINLICSFTASRIAGFNVLTYAAENIVIKKYKGLPRKHTIVSTCVDSDFFNFEKLMPIKPLGLLSGTYNAIYDAELIEHFLSFLTKHYNHEVFWARNQESDSGHFNLGQHSQKILRYEDMPKIIANSSYGIAICKNDLGDSLKAAMPTKIAEFLSVGRPVIVNSNLGDVQDLLISARVAVALDKKQDISRAAMQLNELLQDPALSYRCREIAEKYFSLDGAVNSYKKIYKEILGLN